MRTRGIATLIVVLSCSCAREGSPPLRFGVPAPPTPSTTCPFGAKGTRVAVRDTAAGVDILLTASGNVGDLRRRARDAAAMYGPGAHRGEGHDGVHATGLDHGLALDRLGVRVRATEHDTADGACIHVEAVEPEEGPAVRAAVHARADRARVGDCP